MLRTQKLGEADRIITLLTRERPGPGGRQGRAADDVEVRRAGSSRSRTSTCSSTRAARSTSSPRPRRSRRTATAIAGDYARYTAGTAMLETAERLTAEESEPAVQQYLLLVGGLRALAEGDARPRARARRVPAARRWRSPATRRASRTAPAAAPPGPHRCFSRRRRRRGVRGLPRRPARSRRPPRRSTLLAALLRGDWAAADASEPRHRREGSGLVAAYLQWHLERGLRSLPLVERDAEASRRAAGDGGRRRRPPPPHPSGARPPGDPARAGAAARRDRHGRQRPLGQGARAAAHRRATRRARRRCSTSSQGAIEIGVRYLSAYAFSTENWKRSPDEVRFLMGFNRDVIRRRRDELDAMGVRVRWAGGARGCGAASSTSSRSPRSCTRDNDVLTLHDLRQLRRPGRDRRRGAPRSRATSRPAGSTRTRSTRRRFARYLDEPDMPDVDLFVRVVRRAAHLELPALAVGLRRAGVPRHAVARLRPPRPVAGDRDLRRSGPALRRGASQRGAAPT